MVNFTHCKIQLSVWIVYLLYLYITGEDLCPAPGNTKTLKISRLVVIIVFFNQVLLSHHFLLITKPKLNCDLNSLLYRLASCLE